MTNGPHYPTSNAPSYRPLVPNIASLRLDLHTRKPYPAQGLLSRINDTVYEGESHVNLTAWAPGDDTLVPFAQAIPHLHQAAPIQPGHQFGPSFTNHWVKAELTFPPAKDDQGLIFEFDPSCEAQIFDEHGNSLQAITGTINSGPLPDTLCRTEHVIPRVAAKKGSYSIIIEVSCMRLMGNGGDGGEFAFAAPEMNRMFTLKQARIVVPNTAVRSLLWDFVILREISSTQAKASSLPNRALRLCNRILDLWDGQADASEVIRAAIHCHELAQTLIGGHVTQRATPKTQVWAIGHCHIDTAWLWRYQQAQQKVARSWSTQCDLMQRWPGYQFAASSAQHYYWLETMYPQIFDQIKGFVSCGQFCPVGGSWVEHDSMMPSGESLVRQYLFGQRYFKSRFGQYCREAWLPDTFGYASQLPQILRLCGVQYFFTHKLSWNNITDFPFSTFNWAALDGTQVLAHMSPVGTYNAQCNYAEVQKSVWNHKNLADSDQTLLLFGNGDGGGGPNEQHLEKLDRLASLGETQAGVPHIGFSPPSGFFDDVCVKTEGGALLPSWQGELYLEYHRGTYTTQTALKQFNRLMEQSLQALEYLATLATLTTGYEYPQAQIDDIWRDVLINQFHDVIPGTSIKMANDDALEIYEKRSKQTQVLLDSALGAITTPSEDILVVDPLRLPRQQVVDYEGGYRLVETDTSGFGKIVSALPSSPKAYRDGDRFIVENRHLRVTLQHGRLVSLVDLALDRELIRPSHESPDGGLVLYKDLPLRFDAWDAEIYHLDSFNLVAFDKVEIENQPLVASLRATVKFGSSKAEIVFALDAVSRLLRIDGEVDWQEKHKFLKFVLPVDVRSLHATYGTQFGVQERPTHRNTPQDQAKFEVCAHMIADISGPDYGVALCSNDKYGYSVEGNSMRISLLRAPTAPDPNTDEGQQHFSFACLPHRNGLDSAVYQQARIYTNPPILRSGMKVAARLPRFQLSGAQSDSIVVETIKRGEDSKDVVIRLYEAIGCHAKGELMISNLAVKEASWVDLLERPLKGTYFGGAEKTYRVQLDFRPFEIKTLMLKV